MESDLGDCKFKVGSRGSKEPSYESWHAMITRCYSKKTQERQKTYKDCEVCEEWHNYSNFKKWYDENYYNIDGCKMCLDTATPSWSADNEEKATKYIVLKIVFLFLQE